MGSTPLHLAGRYRLYEQIGRGRFAAVWLAWDETLARLVAIKVVEASAAEVPVFRTRFLEQVRKAARLSHPAIVAIHEFGESGGPDGPPLPFAVMELLDGEILAHRIDRGPLPRREALRICGQVAAALAYAHETGTAHHDLKPGNVLLTAGGPKVLDFCTGAVTGMPAADAAAGDVRALGLLLSAAVTGRAAPEADLPSDVPFEVAAIHVRCLLPDPAARPPAAEVAAVLAASTEPRRPAVPGGTGTLAGRAHRAVRRRPRTLRYAAALLGALVIAAIIALVVRSASSGRALPAPTVTALRTVPRTITAPTASSPTGGASEPTATPAGPAPESAPAPLRTTVPPSTAPADPAEVLSRARHTVDEGVAAGEIRSDVGVDLDNVLDNLRRDLRQDASTDLRTRLADIHHKIDTRLGENALTPSIAARLHAILDEIRT
ncbi:MAG TPA: protein kinase [Spirillospora sp.]|nr:protein kinase [Spirillospora sp.]